MKLFAAMLVVLSFAGCSEKAPVVVSNPVVAPVAVAGADADAEAFELKGDVVGKTTLEEFRAKYNFKEKNGDTYPWQSDKDMQTIEGVSTWELFDGREGRQEYTVGGVKPDWTQFSFVDGVLHEIRITIPTGESERLAAGLEQKFGTHQLNRPKMTWENSAAIANFDPTSGTLQVIHRGLHEKYLSRKTASERASKAKVGKDAAKDL